MNEEIMWLESARQHNSRTKKPLLYVSNHKILSLNECCLDKFPEGDYAYFSMGYSPSRDAIVVSVKDEEEDAMHKVRKITKDSKSTSVGKGLITTNAKASRFIKERCGLPISLYGIWLESERSFIFPLPTKEEQENA